MEVHPFLLTFISSLVVNPTSASSLGLGLSIGVCVKKSLFVHMNSGELSPYLSINSLQFLHGSVMKLVPCSFSGQCL